MKRLIAFIQIDNMIDLITNSSSELFVIKADKPKEMLAELCREALRDYRPNFTIEDISDRIFEGSHREWEESSKVEQALEVFPEEVREELREKYLTKPNYYAVVFDRDWEYHQNYQPKRILEEIGFEMIDNDY